MIIIVGFARKFGAALAHRHLLCTQGYRIINRTKQVAETVRSRDHEDNSCPRANSMHPLDIERSFQRPATVMMRYALRVINIYCRCRNTKGRAELIGVARGGGAAVGIHDPDRLPGAVAANLIECIGMPHLGRRITIWATRDEWKNVDWRTRLDPVGRPVATLEHAAICSVRESRHRKVT